MKRLIVGMSGASGSIYGIRILEMLRAMDDVESHLVMSRYARLNIDDLVNHSVGRVLDLFGLDTGVVKRWAGQEAISGAVKVGKFE